MNDKDIEAVARAISRNLLLRKYEDEPFVLSQEDLTRMVDAYWTCHKVEATEAIKAYEESKQKRELEGGENE